MAITEGHIEVKGVEWITPGVGAVAGKLRSIFNEMEQPTQVCIGFVLAQDTLTKEMFLYVGVGAGADLIEDDIRRILRWGAKVSPEWIQNVASRFKSLEERYGKVEIG